jgi:hypothetical protein
MLRDFLNLVNSVSVNRIVETTDGMGGVTSTTTTTILPYAAIWSPSQVASYISDKVARTSSHILVVEFGSYTFTIDDKEIVYGGNTYKINGPSDDVMNLGEILVLPLERIE